VDKFDDSPNSGPSKGLLTKYLSLSQMLIRYKDIIMSHGFIGKDNLGKVPKIIKGGVRPIYGVDFDSFSINSPADFINWNLKLDGFLKASLMILTSKQYQDKMDTNNRYLGEELILYQEPTLQVRPGRPNDFNQDSVVLGRNSNHLDFGNAFDLGVGEEGVTTEKLNSLGIRVRISGHTPVGQTALIQKIINKSKPSDLPRWSINIDNSAEHTKMPNITSIFKLIDDKNFYNSSFVTIGGNTGYSKKMEILFKKDEKETSRIGDSVTCQNKTYTVVGEFQKGNYLIYRSEDKFATNNRESNLADCLSK